jgi:hypothetical protein
MNAIGIDMSKNSFHAAFDEQEVLKFVNSKEGINEFLEKLKILNSKIAQSELRQLESIICFFARNFLKLN